MTGNITTVSNTDLDTLHNLLTTQRTRRLDLIADAPKLAYVDGQLLVDSDEMVLSEDGVSSAGGYYQPTKVFDDTIGDAFGIPGHYFRRLRQENRLELIDRNVNHFLHGSSDGRNPADERKFTVRLFRGDDSGGGVARAFLSNRFRAIDNLDMLVTVLGAMADAGLGAQNIGRCDLTESRMYVQVKCPEIRALAPELLKGYRSPFTGKSGADNPVVFAGFVVTNSEVGRASARIVPRITVQVCDNGMTMNKDMVRSYHVGQRREEGIIEYSEETNQKELELVSLKTRDAVKTFLNPEYVIRKVAEMEAQAGVEVSKPEATIKQVIRDVNAIPTALEEKVFNAFLKGGQATAGGVMQAVTAVAQTLDDADTLYDIEAAAPQVLSAAVRFA